MRKFIPALFALPLLTLAFLGAQEGRRVIISSDPALAAAVAANADPGTIARVDLIQPAKPCCGQQLIQAKAKHPRGFKPSPPAVRSALHAAAFARHDHRVKRLPKTTVPAFDCRTGFGNVLPVDDQKDCGDCYGVSSADGCSMALIKAGQLPLDTDAGRLSSQYGLDNPQAFQGGCNGGDPAQVIEFIKTHGLPTTLDYGPYTGSPGTAHLKPGTKLWKIDDWLYCTPAQQYGVADVQDMKNCIAQYGPIIVGVDASEFDSYVWPKTMTGRGTNVDHAVLCIGWDDNHDNGDGSKGAFLGMNQWGDWGGPGGTFWIKYGANSWGTEAIAVSAAPLPPPPPSPPVPPPTPPTPPTPAAVTLTLTPAQVQAVLQQAGTTQQPRSFTLTVNPDGSATLTPNAAKK